MDLKQGVIYWFVDSKNPKKYPLGIIRTYTFGTMILGGKTGSHFTGHGETWQMKLSEVSSLGYIAIEDAIKKEIVSKDWQPPSFNKDAADTVERIKNKEL